MTVLPSTVSTASAVPVVPSGGALRGAGVTSVTLDPAGFWGVRQGVNRAATLRHCLDWMERLGWIENFDRVARGETTVDRPGWQFSDSEVYKLLEAMAWEFGRAPDDELAALFGRLVERVAAAQDADGYLNTAFGHPGLPGRWTDLAMGHELYNAGHLLQAAVARIRTGHDDELVRVARRAADQICDEFGESGRHGVCGHPEIEVALAEAGRAFGERRYLEQARLFVDRRGRGTLAVRPLLSAEYFQDDEPVRSATVLRGHAVRALYLSAGAVDVAVDTGDDELLAAVTRQWAATVGARTYLTGGMGSRHQDEGFGDDWELPADRAYCETCAGVASVMLAWRLYLASGEVRYVDLIERTLFNVVATSPSADGRAFFYANPLHQREPGAAAVDGVNTRAEGGVRAPWFEVSCCPTNVARTLASLGAYTASADDEGVSLLQYAAGEVELGGFRMRVDTAYPSDGRVAVRVLEAPEGEARLRMRVPAWADGARLAVGGGAAEEVLPGWVDLRRVFSPGDELVLELPVGPRLTWPDLRIDAVRGTVAVERGPLVLCVESTDLPVGAELAGLEVDVAAGVRVSGDGAVVSGIVRHDRAAGPALPYGAPDAGEGERVELESPTAIDVPLIPYHRWAERGPATMRVFLPVRG
ncbi:glycoside hydrolase family 127 protein [Herbiconiux moechotypicola]|uniref:Glycoside hydrolase family 127 protein n=1 Tax=Herbiconiux moechotypicola TaxID=637393 RepID=A0ABN3DDT8_9MICO|nr:glycoside hydrolase family 127 protein [Herbiconiux moechotypicola]MCS5729226.1 glycoside hydrolase family 127 protein [Herbiconiux moechotypicola]